MADKEIGDLTAASTLDGTELRHIVQGGNSRKETVLQGLTPVLSAANQASVRAAFSAPLVGHIWGLTLSNNATDSDHDIDIAAGEAASTESNPVLMTLASSITKRIDAAWAVGTGNGGLDGTESSPGTPDANTWYSVWLIRRSDTGVVDALFSESATSPTLPTNYDQKRRLGWVKTDGSANILEFTQDGDYFTYVDRQTATPTTIGTTSTTVTFPVPPNTWVRFSARVSSSGAGPVVVFRSSTETDAAPSLGNGIFDVISPGTDLIGSANIEKLVNGSSQITARSSASSTTLNTSVTGWRDTRGRT